MKKLVSLPILAITFAFISLTSAQSVTPIKVNDNSFDYTNTDITEANIQLNYDGNHLVLTVSELDRQSDLPSIAVTVPELGKTDFWGENVNAELEDIAEIELVPYGLNYRAFEVVHPNISVRQVEEAYMARLRELGFEVVQSSNVNPRTYLLENNAKRIRAVFHQSGRGVSVRLT